MKGLYAIALIFIFSIQSFCQLTLCDGVVTQSANVTDGTRTIIFDFDCIAETYTVTMNGPDNEWMGLLFGTTMGAGSNALLYTTVSSVGAIRSYWVAGYTMPSATTNFVFPTISDITNAGIRTVVSGPRAFNTGDAQEIVFTTSDTQKTVRIAYHNGGSLNLAQHQISGSSFIITNLILNPGTLPLDFLSFTIKRIEDGLKIDWTVTNVLNVDKMIVQRSLDGVTWEDLAAYDISTKDQYTHIDKDPYPASSYYRIMVVDKDGSSRYSSTTTFIMPVDRFVDDVLSFLPNPFSDNLSISVAEDYDGSELVQVSITDGTYRTQLQRTMTLNEIQNLDLSHLSAGSYYVVVVHKDWIQRERLVKI